MNEAKDKLFWFNFSFLFFAALLIYGTFSPWLSVASIFNVSGNNSNYGIAPVVLAFGYIIFGLSGILKKSVLNQYRKEFFKGVLAVNEITNIILLGLLYKYLQAVSEFNKTTTNSTDDLSSVEDFFGKEFTDSLENLANSLKPQIGTGYMVCLASSVIGSGILIYLWKTEFRSKSSKPENEN
jgi:hypothetical protein